MATDGITMRSDKALDADLNRATTFQELQELLHRAVERSPEVGFVRDPNTGQFVAREKETPAAATKAADATPRTFEKKGVVIAGKSFDFTAPSELELARQIASANEVAAPLAANESVTPRSARHAASRTPEEIAIAHADADIALRTGRMTTAEYLEATGAVEGYLADQGVDVAKLAQEQSHRAWEEASEIFRNSPAGSDWPGGIKNRSLLGDKLAALGLTDATDKVAALTAAYAELKKVGTLFDGDFSQAQFEAMTDKATPQEIIQAWKSSVQKDVHGDATEANSAFIKNFGGSSSVFDR